MESINLTVTAETASALRNWFDEQNREFIEDLLDGKGQFTLEHGGRTVIVAPVRRGHWIWDSESYHCSECFFHAYGNTLECMDGTYNYCPNCGAKMEE